MSGVHTCTHLIKVHIYCIHCSSEILHVTLARQYNALHVCSVTLCSSQHVFELTNIVL